jgi:hypothetical protein
LVLLAHNYTSRQKIEKHAKFVKRAPPPESPEKIHKKSVKAKISGI